MVTESEARQPRRGMEYDIEKAPPIDYAAGRGSTYEDSYGEDRAAAPKQELSSEAWEDILHMANDPFSVYHNMALDAIRAELPSPFFTHHMPGMPGLSKKEANDWLYSTGFSGIEGHGEAADYETTLVSPHVPEQYAGEKSPGHIDLYRWGIAPGIYEENLKRVVKEEYKKLLEEHAKDYVWGVKAPYGRAANQYELKTLHESKAGILPPGQASHTPTTAGNPEEEKNWPTGGKLYRKGWHNKPYDMWYRHGPAQANAVPVFSPANQSREGSRWSITPLGWPNVQEMDKIYGAGGLGEESPFPIGGPYERIYIPAGIRQGPEMDAYIRESAPWLFVD